MAGTMVRVRDSNGRFVRRPPAPKAAVEPAPAHTPPVTPTVAPVTDLAAPEWYINRELSLLAFQWRVFEQARDEHTPLLERVKFLAILSTNLDEFFMVRVSGLKQQVEADSAEIARDGMTPRETLHEIHKVVFALMESQCRYLNDVILPALAENDIHLLTYDELNENQRHAATDYFMHEVFPVLTPLAVDSGHPFPHISNRSLNLLVVVRDEAGEHIARVKIPQSLPRFVPVTTTAPMRDASGIHRPRASAWLEQVVIANLPTLFPGKEIVAAYPFHVTRDADIEIREIEAEDLLVSIQEQLERRSFGFAVRLVVDATMPEVLRNWLMEKMDVYPSDVYTLNGYLGLGDLMQLLRIDRPDLKDPPFVAQAPPVLKDGSDIYTTVRQGDILLHHPYDSFVPIVDFIKAGSTDPAVRAIKQTLYRVGKDSPIVEALGEARDEDTQVAVLVELKARFDEENNIEWARALESKGVHVAYGMMGLKVHCKVALIVRREQDGIRRYVHLGTGNYNASTARTYTDLGLLTANEEIGADASDLFNYLTGYSDQREYRKLLVGPVNLRRRIFELIARETALGPKGRLIFKMNNLVDEEMIESLYRASQAGVKIDLICRTICCLRPGVPGLSENIRVISILGRFLEHSRIYLFGNDGHEEIYLGSADLMTRNLDRRVEVLFPIEDAAIRAHIRDDILETYLRDTDKARQLDPDGHYRPIPRPDSEPPFNAQEWLLSTATGATRY
jgi:polyphosphate kinase